MLVHKALLAERGGQFFRRRGRFAKHKNNQQRYNETVACEITQFARQAGQEAEQLVRPRVDDADLRRGRERFALFFVFFRRAQRFEFFGRDVRFGDFRLFFRFVERRFDQSRFRRLRRQSFRIVDRGQDAGIFLHRRSQAGLFVRAVVVLRPIRDRRYLRVDVNRDVRRIRRFLQEFRRFVVKIRLGGGNARFFRRFAHSNILDGSVDFVANAAFQREFVGVFVVRAVRFVRRFLLFKERNEVADVQVVTFQLFVKKIAIRRNIFRELRQLRADDGHRAEPDRQDENNHRAQRKGLRKPLRTEPTQRRNQHRGEERRQKDRP